VVTQDTGIGSVLPLGDGLFAWRTMEEAIEAIEAVNADYAGHSAAARDLAASHFDTSIVLGSLLERVGAPCAC
jgi:hypothetical protein